jgi:hypothetical protein
VSRHTDCASQPPLFSAHVVLGLHPVLPPPRCSGASWNLKERLKATRHITVSKRRVVSSRRFQRGFNVSTCTGLPRAQSGHGPLSGAYTRSLFSSTHALSVV